MYVAREKHFVTRRQLLDSDNHTNTVELKGEARLYRLFVQHTTTIYYRVSESIRTVSYTWYTRNHNNSAFL
jgi:hypothetical protein